MPTPQKQLDRKLLEQARELDQFGRRVERYLSMQLQQLEMALASFERERAAWQRQRQAEIAQIEQNRKALDEAWKELQTEEQSRGKRPKARPPSDRKLSASEEQRMQPQRMCGIGPAESKAAGTGSAPLKVLLQPGSTSEQWLGGLLLEISKLNWEIGGSGVRFEPGACRVPRTLLKRRAPTEEAPFADVLVELEVFSCQPLVGWEKELAFTTGGSDDLIRWERFKSTLLLTSLVDQKLVKEFRKSTEAAREHPCWQRIASASRRVEDANPRIGTTGVPPGLAGLIGQPVRGGDPLWKQIKRIETVADVLSKECGMRVHVSLI